MSMTIGLLFSLYVTAARTARFKHCRRSNSAFLDVDPVACLLEHPVGERRVGRGALVDGHPQAAEHNRDEAAGAGAADHVEVVAGFGRGERDAPKNSPSQCSPLLSL